MTLSSFSIFCASTAFKKDVRGISRGALPALERENWNRSRAARLLGMHRNTLLPRLAAWGVRAEDSTRALPPAAGGGGP